MMVVVVEQVSQTLALSPSGLVSLPQIERIQFFQEIGKGQEESQVSSGTWWGGAPPQTPSQSTHTHTSTPSAQHKQALGAVTRQMHTREHTAPFLTAQIASQRHRSSPAVSHSLPAHFCSLVYKC